MSLPLITLDELKAKHARNIERAEVTLQIARDVLDICKGLAGKKLTKAIATKLEAKYKPDGWAIFYRLEHGMLHISAWHNDKLPYNERFDGLVAHEGEMASCDPAKVEYNLRAYLLNEERIPKMRKGTKKLAKLHKQLHAARDAAMAIASEAKELEIYPLSYVKFGL